jgi:hypothetical protein
VVPGSDANGTGGGGGEGRTLYVGNDALTFPRANMQAGLACARVRASALAFMPVLRS